jgi:hypothetical protein
LTRPPIARRTMSAGTTRVYRMADRRLLARLVVGAGTVIAHQPALPRGRLGQDGLRKLESDQIWRKFLSDHSVRVVHLEQIARPAAAICRPSVPYLAPEQDRIARFTKRRLLLYLSPLRVAIGAASSSMTTGHELHRTQLFVQVIKIVMGSGGHHRQLHSWIRRYVRRQVEGPPVHMQLLVLSPGPVIHAAMPIMWQSVWRPLLSCTARCPRPGQLPAACPGNARTSGLG